MINSSKQIQDSKRCVFELRPVYFEKKSQIGPLQANAFEKPTVAVPIERLRSFKFYRLEAGVPFKFCPFSC